MAYGHGHTRGTKRERQPRKATTAKLEALGQAIAQQLQQLTPQEVYALAMRPVR